jgi:hypothetical protein
MNSRCFSYTVPSYYILGNENVSDTFINLDNYFFIIVIQIDLIHKKKQNSTQKTVYKLEEN